MTAAPWSGVERLGEADPDRMITVYGIKNCDTMKKARAWLDKHGVAYAAHECKTAGVAPDRLEACE